MTPEQLQREKDAMRQDMLNEQLIYYTAKVEITKDANNFLVKYGDKQTLCFNIQQVVEFIENFFKGK